MSGSIITPERELANLVQAFDEALQCLDRASSHFSNSILSAEDIIAEAKSAKDVDDFRILVENYVLMSGFLLDNPLLEVIRKIRAGESTAESDANIMFINKDIKPGQQWKHYKGQVYRITSVAKNANMPYIMDIHYTCNDGNIWSLPIHEFSKQVEWNEATVPRFTLVL